MNGVTRIAAVALVFFSAPWFFAANTPRESFTLSVRLRDPYNRDLTALIPVQTNKPFHLEQTNGAVKNSFYGMLHSPIATTYPLTLTVSEWVSPSNNIRDTTKFSLKLDHSQSGGPVSSFVYSRTVILSRNKL